MTANPPETTQDDTVMGAALGRAAVPGQLDPGQSLWGFGGLHGGLTLALLVRAIQQQAGPIRLASVNATFLKPLRGSFEISTSKTHSGRAVEFWRASAIANGQTAVIADAVLSVGKADRRPIAPDMPPAPPPQDCAVFRPPPSFVPISTRMEVRPTGTSRPYSGGTEAELTAWLRLTDDDEPADVARFAMLMDALAPSYAAILDSLVPIPTVTLTVSPTPGLPIGDSPWILLRARTVAASADGWVDEHLDAWSADGLYLGHGLQRRLVLVQG